MKKLLFILILFAMSLEADSKPVIKVWLRVSSPVNVQIFLNNKLLMQIDRTTGQNFAYGRG